MTDTRVALGSDRLPWLQDVPDRSRAGPVRLLLACGAIVVLLIAGASYWLGLQSRLSEPETPAPIAHQRTVTTQLPEPQVAPQQFEVAPGPQVEPTPAPEVRPIPTPVVRSVPPKRVAAPRAKGAAEKTADTEEKAVSSNSESAKTETAAATSAAKSTVPPALAPANSLRLWPSRVTTGAHGRVVQIGAFGSVHQAKLGWRHMAGAYPGVKRLPAVVVEARNSKGRKFYRFQIGTTSQAHSEVLCQRMQKIDFSCAVMGLPGESKGIER